ncbi:MAG: hypothetical protein LUG99_15080 [Lachnospiraceae bacterium]|nr:hypothetical protein [Lachnospiraceae bacterium]
MKRSKKKNRHCKGCRKYIIHVERPLFEGDGEEIFYDMIDDMLELASYVDMMYENTRLLSLGEISERMAMNQSALAMESSDAVLSRWELYSQPEV